jgi:hypothetical protein
MTARPYASQIAWAKVRALREGAIAEQEVMNLNSK